MKFIEYKYALNEIAYLESKKIQNEKQSFLEIFFAFLFIFNFFARYFKKRKILSYLEKNKYKLNNSSSSVEYLQNDLLIEGESTDQYFENASYGFLDILGFGKINAFSVDVLYKRDGEKQIISKEYFELLDSFYRENIRRACIYLKYRNSKISFWCIFFAKIFDPYFLSSTFALFCFAYIGEDEFIDLAFYWKAIIISLLYLPMIYPPKI